MVGGVAVEVVSAKTSAVVTSGEMLLWAAGGVVLVLLLRLVWLWQWLLRCRPSEMEVRIVQANHIP